ncbi:MAG TPA: regulatory protein RecX [Desulfuromonadaceae bacterium]
MKNSDPSPERGYVYALRLLAARDYSSARISEKLLAREYSQADAEAIVARLQSEGWINDRRFAERFAESALAAGRFFGPRLKLEMSRRGISTPLVNEILAHRQNDEGDAARLVLTRRFPDFNFEQASDKERRKVIGFLQRRGFRFSIIMQVMKKTDY